MKTSNKSTIATGIALLLIAALFSISLILQALGFGMTEAGQKNIFYMLGNILYSVYGFSSILIPAFLFISGLSCFASKWSARKTMRLLTAIVPFFTAVITENICRSILELEHSGFPGVKVFVAVVTGIMLIIIEYLGAGIIADKINPILFGNQGFGKHKIASNLVKVVKKQAAAPAKPEVKPGADSGTADSEVPEAEKIENPLAELNQIGKLNTDSLIFGKENDDSEQKDDEEVSVLSVAKMSSENFENEVNPEDLIPEPLEIEDDVQSDEIKDEISSVFDKALSNVKAEPVGESIEEESIENEDYAEPGASIITEEEYAALTDFGADEEESQPEELEWNNLPPKQDTLPPEYDEDYNDDFIEDYVDEEDASVQNTQDIQNAQDENDGFEVIDEDDPDLEFPPQEEQNQPLAQDASDDEDPFSAFDVDLDTKVDSEPENAYSATKYIDSVVENPRFGHGITLREGEAPAEDKADTEKKTFSEQKPKFPSKINLEESGEDVKATYHVEAQGEAQSAQTEPQKENEPKTADEPGAESDEPSARQYEPNARQYEPGAEPVEKESIKNPSAERILSAAEKSSALFAASHEKNDDSFGVGDVFAQMEDDIRKESLKKLSEETAKAYLNGELKESVAAGEAEEETESELRGAEEPQSKNDAHQEADFYPEPETSATDLTANGEDEIAQMEVEFEEAAPDDNDDIYDDESVAFDDAVNKEYEESDAFALEEEPEPERQQIMPNPPRIGNRAVKKGPYVIPSDLLTAYKDDQYWIIDDATKESALNLTQTLAEFNIEAKVIAIKKGPVVTMFEILPAPGVRLQKIVALQDNIALSLAAQSVRIVAPIPGKQAVGIEVPNRHRSIVGFRELIEMKLDEWDKMAVPVVLGKDILGKAQLIDLVKTPHMLIAGATGSGKSVCVNSLILSILYKRSFRDVKLILVDPKVVELKLYNNIPHLLVPVITEPKKALQALQWCLCEMERRYALLDSMGVRDISTYNQRIKEREIATEKLPYIVVIIDEFADLMATSGRELESTVARLTAMSRAVGIHLVLATQRPSVNVITGLIKANIPSRIAFMVSSRTDSNIIIDSVGAEKLLGRGDMLYASAVDPAPVRIQGTYISDQEVEDVVKAVKEYGEPDYIDDQVFFDEEDEGDDFELNGNYDGDPLYDQALEIVIQSGKASASYLQRRLSIGYNRAARLVEEMEERGIVGPANGSKPREIIHVPG